ncbi:uncharacterized protein K452DRAFT_144297 [Aplosporella prunicola CBS 121167]|uniref:Mediator of RNA polymerase II transcription subunit 9 n=1 Tax=Aplosporella prunicola CBS 121167 TaxID=1176127 RepID=A0A6A6BKE5_9PEZI|nr:uncharacterized protein K452DRAFT_144297 [Aplosporella prunicola CBS 121167]KAF2144592.1 hypothetical protein K452DRAFT_144297 [Aplosporella prunicola CBS 121167]
MAATGTPRVSTPATPASRSFSHAPTSSKSLANTGSAQPDTPQLPPPASFDVLPHLHTLLGRLLIPAGDDASAKPGDGTGAGQQGAADDKASDAAPLDIQQLTAASSGLKTRLQKARQACARLGDVDRTVDEQMEEMEELEERVRKLRQTLNRLGVGVENGARQSESRDVLMR